MYLIFEFLSMDLKKYLDSLGPNKMMDADLVRSYLYQVNIQDINTTTIKLHFTSAIFLRCKAQTVCIIATSSDTYRYSHTKWLKYVLTILSPNCKLYKYNVVLRCK